MSPSDARGAPRRVILMFGGDTMIGRGVDQILPRPGDPTLHEAYVTDARRYVALAEDAHGPIPRPVDLAYPWGEALSLLDAVGPVARIVNLETSITSHDAAWPHKAVHYRMHPDNAACLATAGIDVCAVANNHVLDYGIAGLKETLAALRRAGIGAAGAGEDLTEAHRPVRVRLDHDGDVVVVGLGHVSSGIPPSWAATADRPGIALLADLSEATLDETAARLAGMKRPGDLLVVSIHWGANWGYRVSEAQVRFARRLVEVGADVVHGHSSHHARPLEIHRGRLILYGCGELLDDYEGIGGHTSWRGDLAPIWLPALDRSGALSSLRIEVMRIRRMRLERAPDRDVDWFARTLKETSAAFGTRVGLEGSAGARHVTVRP
jgi:poly-gamma-glutamate capsule biosynthesis protein CapA/YwtB (metallophosphatase superfamily)